MLLIGESGVGKSTWINAFANYCMFPSLDQAVRAGGLFPIAYTLRCTNPATKQSVRISSDDESVLLQDERCGGSVTQMPKEYVFEGTSTKINVIDTPGLLDTGNSSTSDNAENKPVNKTSDHDVDKKHVNNILRLLSSYNKIDAICVLIKASQNRLNEPFSYVLTEILKHLDTGARNNVVFIITYATDFEADTVEGVLRQFFKDNNISTLLPVEKQKIFCFDNRGVDYLLKRKHKFRVTDNEKTVAEINWKQSVESKNAMLTYVCGLKPHSLENINAMHDAQHMIGVLSKLVLDILLCIYKDNGDLEAVKAITDCPAGVKKAKQRKVVRTRLGHVNVVCSAPKCATAKVVDEKIVHQRICCENCKGQLLSWCLSFDWKGKCKVCGCDKRTHEWIVTQTKIVTEEVDENQVKGSKKEAGTMLRTCAKLNAFVRQNVLLTTFDDDELSKSLKTSIDTYSREKGDSSIEVKYLMDIQQQYQQFLDQEMKHTYSKEDTDKQTEELYTLQVKGAELRAAMKEERQAKLEVAKQAGLKNIVRITVSEIEN